MKRYTDLSAAILAALRDYVDDERRGAFPATEHTCAMPDDELRRFESQIGVDGRANASTR